MTKRDDKEYRLSKCWNIGSTSCQFRYTAYKGAPNTNIDIDKLNRTTISPKRQDIDRTLGASTTNTPSTKMSLRPLRTLRPILSQIHYTPYRPYSTPNNSNEASSSSSKPVIPIPTPSQSEPLPADKKPLELPQLPRPLGVALEPTSSTGTWSEKKERYLDEDRQKAKRKAL
jgi:hypothetical protein